MKIAVIGAGYWGPNIIRNLLELKQDVTVFDRIPARSEQMISQFPRCTSAGSLSSILGDKWVDAVAIVVPAPDHTNLIVQSLEAGKQVFVEKPMCMTLQEADRIRSVLRDRVFMTGHITSYSPGLRTLKRCIGEGLIGRLQSLSLDRTHCGPIYKSTDVLSEVAAHDVALLLMLYSDLPSTVSACGYSRLDTGAWDSVRLVLNWQSGTVAFVNVSWACAFRKRTAVAEGSLGTLSFALLNGSEHLTFFEEKAVFDALRRGMSQKEVATLLPAGRELPLASVEPLQEELKHFISCMESGREPETGFDFSNKVVAVLAAARISLEQMGKRIML